MAANLGQAFLGGGGMVPTLAQELASGNYHESRESFHDYIYSKLILGEDKGSNPNPPNVTSSNPPVFPNTNLANSYPNPPVSSTNSSYSHSSTNTAQTGGNGGMANVSGNITPGGSKASSTLTLKSHSTPKSGSSKKKSSSHGQPTPQQANAGTIDVDGLTKVKKKSHHKKKEKTNVCDVCGRAFAEKYTLNRHMLTHTHIKPYSCSKCNMAFSRSDGLAKHMAAGHRRIDAHHCDVCGGTFNSEVSYEQHRREYGNTLPFVCNLCMLAFSQCCHLNYHMKSHSLSKMNDSFSSDGPDDKSNAIDVSELIPDDFSPPKKDSLKDPLAAMYLPQVGLTSSLKPNDGTKKNDDHSMSLLDPNIVIKPEIDDMPSCSQGHESSLANSSYDGLGGLSSARPSISSTPAGLANSFTTPSTTPSYLPDTSGNLNSAASSDANPISDSDMKKYFDIKIPNPKGLTEGVDSQGSGTGEDGLFRCPLCGKGFTRKYHMQRHVKLHTRGPIPKAHLLDWTRRPYACGVCKMGFTRQHHLTRHMLIHTGERPHSCHVCGKAFRRFTNLSLHVRTVHGAERPFKCHICGRGFPRLYSLQRHLKLHAKNAAGLGSTLEDQLYRGFKAVGTVNVEPMEEGKSPSYNSSQPSGVRASPDHSRESISSEHSDDSERGDHESSAQEDSMENIDPDGGAASSPDHGSFTHMQEHSSEKVFLPRTAGPSDKREEPAVSMSGQSEERLAHGQPQPNSRLVQQNVMSPEDENLMAQQGRLSNPNVEAMRRQTPMQARTPNDFNPNLSRQGSEGIRGQNLSQASGSGEYNPTSRQGSESLRGHSSLQAPSSSDFNPQQSRPTSNNERFNPAVTLPSQGMRAIDMQATRNFSDMDIREAASYTLNQRGGENFAMPQQRIQSPHPMLNTLDRPGSRSMMTTPDNYHPSPASYTQQQLNLQNQQQRASMDLSAARNTMSPAGLRDFAHNHHLDLGGNRSGLNEPPAYAHSHGVNNLQFPGGGHALYQQQLGDNLNHMDMHPNPSGSPMPVNSHNNNMQY